ncbi:MAG: glycosyl transferase family 2 [Bacteroidetes bacterium]|nr:MAG: glycosyl transferase family 2 [Bacteroidota bacterium]
MPTPKRISVVLPFYNAEATLERAISSIALQDYPNFECILVDNNSTDKGADVARAWCEADRRFRFCREERQGVMFASNRACEEAQGAYLARMDADDRAHPSRLSLQAAFLDHHPDYGAVAGRARHVGNPKTTAGFSRFVDWSNSLLSYEDIYNRRFIEAPIINPTAMWRRELMESHGLYRHGDFPEDYEMWLRWLDAGVRIGKVPEVVLDWHDSAGRLTRTNERYSDQAFYRIKSRYLAHWLRQYNPHPDDTWVWGASRISRRRARMLEKEGVRIAGYIDTKETRQLEASLMHYSQLPTAGRLFVLSYIRQMDNRDRIRSFLAERGYREGCNYLMVS